MLSGLFAQPATNAAITTRRVNAFFMLAPPAALSRPMDHRRVREVKATSGWGTPTADLWYARSSALPGVAAKAGRATLAGAR